MSTSEAYRRFYTIIRKIPRGRVATYGQIARLAGLPAHARQVGYALNVALDPSLPWHRVVNAAGRISIRSAPGDDPLQRQRLEKENVIFNRDGRIDLPRFQWRSGLRGMRGA